MSRKEGRGLSPKLRFPDFANEEPWSSDKFDSVYDLKSTNSLSRDKLNYDQGSIKNIHYGDIHTNFESHFDVKKENVPFINPSEDLSKVKPESYCQETDVVLADASEDLDDIGKSIEIVNLDGQKMLSGLHTLLARQRKALLVKGFAGHLFKSKILRQQIQKEAQGAKVLGISAGRISRIDVVYPSEQKEQQKIAKCLSSIDKLIIAQAKKIEALKSHKRGLMQKIFPAEGKITPELRFPEFRKSGEWKSRTLSSLTPNSQKYGIVDGPFGSNLKTIHYRKEGVPIITSGYVTEGVFWADRYDYVEQAKYDKEKRSAVKGGDIVMAKIGARCGASAVMPVDHSPGILSGNALKITVDETINSTMFVWQSLWYLHSSGRLESLKKVGAQPAISIGNLKKFELFVPEDKKEQEKIAASLSSVDKLIKDCEQKHESLTAHKKGLMQQLFPNMDGS